MVDLKKDNLEKALTGKKDAKEENKLQMPKEIEIGFHQGALTTLVNERNEMVRMVQQIESVMMGHIKRLEELGVKIKMNSEEPKK